MDVRTELESAQLEAAAASVVGQIVFLLSRLELNLGLYLRNAVGGRDPEAVNPLIERLSFKGKLDALRDVVERKFADNDQCQTQFLDWFGAVDAYRAKRNAFVHGRWGVDHRAQCVINVAGGMPDSKRQKERRFELADLDDELSRAKNLAVAFYKWSDRWPS